jgi:hypothetical protein
MGDQGQEGGVWAAGDREAIHVQSAKGTQAMRLLNILTERKSFAALSLGAMLLGGLAGTLTRPLPARALAPIDTSGPCKDPWINAAYHQIAVRPPIGNSLGAGTSVGGECNVSLYGGGKWGNYDDLYGKVKTYLRIEAEVNVSSLAVFGRLADDATLTTYGQQPEHNVSVYINDLKATVVYGSAERQATINRAYLAATGRAAGSNDYNYYQNKRDNSMYVDMVQDITKNLWAEPNQDSSEKVQVIRRAYAAAGLTPSNKDIYGIFNIGGWVHGPAKSYVQQVAENKNWAAQHRGSGVSTASYIGLPDALYSQLSSALGSQVAAIVAQGGGNIVAQGGGNIVAQGGGNIVAQGGGNIVAQGGGNIISQDGNGFFSAGAFG